MPEYKRKFEQHRVDMLERGLKRDAENGMPTEYEILVDNTKIVSRTNNLEHFGAYQMEIDDGAETLTIVIYDNPQTNSNKKHIFDLRSGDTEALGYIERGLRDEIAAAKEKLRLVQEEKRQLQAEYDDLLRNQFSLGGINIAELGSVVLEKFILRAAPKLLQGTALAGLINTTDAPVSPASPESPSEVTFEKQPESPALTPDQQRHLANLHALERALTPEQLELTMKILENFIQHPENIVLVAEFLGIK